MADDVAPTPVERGFDELIHDVDTAMVVVTVSVDGEQSGCLIGFHAQCSISPRRYALWISKANHTYELALRAEAYGVHFLGAGDLALARLFGTTSGDEIDKFEQAGWTAGDGGVPLLDACPTRMVLRRHALFDAGEDHICVVGEPVEADADGGFTPLRLRDVEHLEPGHEADEKRHDG